MTISITTNKAAYIGNGVAISFAIPFPFLAQEHLKVYQLLNDIQTERTDWTVSDGNLVFAAAPADNAQIVIMREVPLTQETDYRENEILPAETLERCFDKLTMQIQQLAEKSARAVTVDVFDDTAADSLIPSIRKAVSDCQTAVGTTTANAQTATEQASLAAAILGTKASVGLDNLTAAGKESISHLSMPSDSFVELTLGASGTVYTAVADGVFFVGKNAAGANQYIYADVYKGNTFLYTCNMLSHSTESLNLLIPVSKGSSVIIRHNLSGTTNVFRFIYANGCVQGE